MAKRCDGRLLSGGVAENSLRYYLDDAGITVCMKPSPDLGSSTNCQKTLMVLTASQNDKNSLSGGASIKNRGLVYQGKGRHNMWRLFFIRLHGSFSMIIWLGSWLFTMIEIAGSCAYFG